jgi:hypothetical protein
MEKEYNLNQMSPYKVQLLISTDDVLRSTIAENMMNHGGSFVQALGKCLLLADRINRVKIAEAWPYYIVEYQPNKWPKDK